MAAYDPIIRSVHQAVNLSGTVADLQAFLDDMIRLSKPSSDQAVSVEDFVRLLEKHQGSSHRFIHQVAKNGQDITEEYRQYMHGVAAQFRVQDPNAKRSIEADAGALTPSLNELVDALQPSERATVTQELDAHAGYLKALSSQSTARTQAVMTASGTTELGPGIFLARWQALLDDTPITPAEAAGEVRHGGSADVTRAARIDTDGEQKGGKESGENSEVRSEVPKAPSVENTLRLLSKGYKEILRKGPTCKS